MSELRHLANSQSPLFNTLQSFSSNDPFEYEIAKSYPNVVKTRVELNMDSNASLGSQVVMALPKYGLLYKAVVKTRLQFKGDGTNSYRAIVGLGSNIISRASWMVHNKTIEQQTPLSCDAYLSSLGANEKEALKEIMRYNINVEFLKDETAYKDGESGTTLYPENSVGNSNQMDVYTPLFFSFSHNSKQAVDLTFLQSTNLVLQYANASDLHDTVRGDVDFNTASTLAIKASASKVILYYYQMPNDTMKEIERTLFDATTPLTILGKSFFAETDKLTDAKARVQDDLEEITVDLNCKNCVYQTAVAVRFENDGTDSGDKGQNYRGSDYVPIYDVELRIGGRSIWKVSGDELNYIDNAWGSGSNPFGGNQRSGRNYNSGITDASPGDNIVLINHGVVPSSHSQNSGCLSLKNCSSPQLVVRVQNPQNNVTDAGTKYRVMVGHFHYNLITQSGLDGAVQVGISL